MLAHTRFAAAKVTIVCLVFGTLSTLAAKAEEIDDRAVQRAHRFLGSTNQGKFILDTLHFGVPYRDHNFTEIRQVSDANGKKTPGHFALIYRFEWGANSDGWTDLACLCNPKGSVYRLKVVDSNGILQRPFVMADATIQVVGQSLVEALKGNMDENDREQLKQFVDAADSKGLLELGLQIRQAAGF